MKLRRMIQTTGLLLLGSTVTAAYGQVTPPDTEWFTRFSQCDAEFFKTLQQQAPLFRQVAPLEKQGEYTRFKMPGPNSPKKEQLMFTQPLKLGDIELIGYRNEIDDLERLGIYYFWGFITRGTVKEVAEKIHPFVYENQRFRQDGESFVRSEIRIGSRWTPSKSTSNTPPGLSRVERVFLVEPSHEDPNAVFISCSIQGGIEAGLLTETRPDIPASEQVLKAPPLPPFAELSVPEKVTSAISTATQNLQSNWWEPKFKKLRYVVTIKNQEPKRSRTLEVHTQAMDNQTQSDIYIPPNPAVFSRSLESLAGLTELKQENALLNQQSITTDIALKLPQTLEKGATIEIERKVQIYRSPKHTQTISNKKTCQVQETLPAKYIHPVLSGNAIELSCQVSNFASTFIFLEDLGLAINFDRNDPTTQITKFEITR